MATSSKPSVTIWVIIVLNQVVCRVRDKSGHIDAIESWCNSQKLCYNFYTKIALKKTDIYILRLSYIPCNYTHNCLLQLVITTQPHLKHSPHVSGVLRADCRNYMLGVEELYKPSELVITAMLAVG